MELKWPQVELSLGDHAVNNSPYDAGKVFYASDALPDNIREAIVNLRLGDVKKAGTESHQRACAATAWLLCNSHGNFNSVTDAWKGLPLIIYALVGLLMFDLLSELFKN